MTTIAIIGAGPGLGAAVARRFGREGFSVALVARGRDRLDRLVSDLVADGVRARGYVADVRDRGALAGALDSAATELGPVEVLQYSPVPSAAFLRPVSETSVEDLAAAVEFSVLGPASAIARVLPGMRESGRGTILLVNGASAVTPNGAVAGTSTAFAAESAYGAMLHDALASENIHVGQLVVPGAIGGGDPLFAPDALAGRLWTIHAERGPYRTTVGG
ncbi:SDR family NAD(P)-dependent oxidoreductase [Streptomyces sp. 3MP-14]|uniref:SDR family NAD(P)-dependent oxidoreductase n=1 Tax=Streptomyces mimosae TaxID=2586635 RepID=A0A5N5ZU99_9ACTN|nr:MULTISPECIES: SDR family NAD(P)-dependent oxidoreductase [Streptomyces]KAB8159472.1 SDR family NAD(P)-dependent oxidoreductase [Streptomyces mimosae]KAB8172640.1 SDR family NAD(P)-dependent oxidoreductase [Streptomyces sp. 3MP-14]